VRLENFYHDDQSARQVLDARSEPGGTIYARDVFYLVYRVSVGNAWWYHHGVLLADTMNALFNGSLRLTNQMREEFGFEFDANPVFIRNLMVNEEQLKESRDESGISEEIGEYLVSKKAEPGFMVVGLIGDEELLLVKIVEPNGIDALLVTQQSVLEQKGSVFFPLELIQSHPSNQELSAHFDRMSKRFKTVLSVTNGNTMH